MSKKKVSKAKRPATSEINETKISKIKFWIFSFENVEVNHKTLLMFYLFVTCISVIGIVLFIGFMWSLVQLNMFEKVIELVKTIKA
ncbi:hypothetical protein GM418_10820 [Maribellus comscasis]|uniref:Uncharacterized protein n=1 Tax=Maribellus comscasis TaxID=2681766 RepID=A0A6I6JVE2_9BACT|nr:hypothetical protein [Maribellus comscasis]QGY44132.1 hypothetical protein GM418_10820 [Maribellus comscasis]